MMLHLDLLEVQSSDLPHDVSKRLGDLEHLVGRLLIRIATGVELRSSRAQSELSVLDRHLRRAIVTTRGGRSGRIEARRLHGRGVGLELRVGRELGGRIGECIDLGDELSHLIGGLGGLQCVEIGAKLSENRTATASAQGEQWLGDQMRIRTCTPVLNSCFAVTLGWSVPKFPPRAVSMVPLTQLRPF